MVVDDEFDVRLALAMTLEDSGYEIFEAVNGREALSSVRVVNPDLILLDINMPEMDGFQVLEQLKTYRETADIPVVMISARSAPRDRGDALFMGAVDYITKPWSEGELELRVSWALTQGKSITQGNSGRGVTGRIDTEAFAGASV
ncbi:MAG: response regulator [Chloroflexi bacterium]|nr:response regulator [Chloroflexota bacterium]